MKHSICAAWAVCTLLLAPGASMATDPTPAVAAEPVGAPHELFGAGFLDFRRTSGKVVGVYVPNWQPVKLVDDMPGGAVTHVLYAFLRLCGPGQLTKDAPACQGKADFQLA